jgi:tRNA pseudouridine synthase 10
VRVIRCQFFYYRDELHHIKSGEEEKRKFYRALCTVRDGAVTPDLLRRLEINEPFEIQQLTPFRVLHRRTLMKRPRTIYKVKAFAVKGK